MLCAWYPQKPVCGCVATSRCPLINFFRSPDDLAAWRAPHLEEPGVLLSLAEAVAAGKAIFGHLLRP